MCRVATLLLKMTLVGFTVVAVLSNCTSSTGQQLESPATAPVLVTAGTDTYFTLVDSVEFADYRQKAELKLKENELFIAELKDRLISRPVALPLNYIQQLDSLSLSNTRLRNKMKNYNSNKRIKWESFKIHFTGELDAIGRNIYLLDERI